MKENKIIAPEHCLLVAKTLAEFWHNNWNTMSYQSKNMYLNAATKVMDAIIKYDNGNDY